MESRLAYLRGFKYASHDTRRERVWHMIVIAAILPANRNHFDPFSDTVERATVMKSNENFDLSLFFFGIL